MLWIVAKLASVLVLVWLYLSAKNQNGPGIQWAVIGFIGYWLTWWLSHNGIDLILGGVAGKNTGIAVLGTQAVPIALSLLAVFFVRKKLINDLPKTPGETLSE